MLKSESKSELGQANRMLTRAKKRVSKLEIELAKLREAHQSMLEANAPLQSEVEALRRLEEWFLADHPDQFSKRRDYLRAHGWSIHGTKASRASGVPLKITTAMNAELSEILDELHETRAIGE